MNARKFGACQRRLKHAAYGVSVAAVVSVYVLLPLLQVLLVTVLAILGYMDAWFGFRRRMKKA